MTNDDTASYSYADDVAVAPGNGAYLLSQIIGTNWLGTNQYTNNGFSLLLSRFDSNGSNLWSRPIGRTNLVFSGYNTLVADASGNVTVGGYLSGSLDFGGTNIALPAGYNGFLAQYDSNGTVLWLQTLPAYPQSLAQSGGQIYCSFTAYTSGGTTNVGAGNTITTTDRAFGLAALNATSGQVLWVRGVGGLYGAPSPGIGDDNPRISASGTDVFLLGTAYGASAVFGELNVPIADGRGQYFARYDTNGNAQVATNFGSTTTMTWASSANSSGVYVCGDFDEYTEVGDYLVTAMEYFPSYLGSNYFTQPFVAKLDRDGNALWELNGISPVLANFRGVTATTGGVWMSGFLQIENQFIKTRRLVPVQAQFGTNRVASDAYIPAGSGFETPDWTRGGMVAKINEIPAPVAVTLINPQIVGTNLQFTFQSQAGLMNFILYRTNLATGSWLTNSSVLGTGAVLTNTIPLSVFSPSKTGFVRVSTQ